ncbi:hypothetical protein GYA13_03860 [Candidatus Kuenenbacteria bacterium]|nr:hypothetical protein [Candidatus Kuenenbacteria bacterium]
MKADVKKHIGRQQDKKWKQYNENLQKFSVSNDFIGLASTYQEMANFVKNEGKDNTHLLDLAYEMKLKFQTNLLNEYKKSNVVTEVEIIATDNSCEACMQLNGNIFPINEALLKKLLPVKNCSHKYGCRCVYVPIVD